MSNDATLRALGSLITENMGRDAVHIAVTPMQAWRTMKPGEHIGLIEGHPPLGIVDPYLHNTVKQGERFWLFLYPGSITSLRHEWTHDAF